MPAATAVPSDSPSGFSHLPRKPVSEVKRDGWRGIMRSVDAAGALLMTNHDRPEAVILSLGEYRQLSELAAGARRANEAKLQALARAFDDDLARLKQPDAGQRLRDAFAAPLALKGKAIAGRGY
jgi:PHD/YefM family antitoxin component YafN of YafNO toxin-antitoxin module